MPCSKTSWRAESAVRALALIEDPTLVPTTFMIHKGLQTSVIPVSRASDILFWSHGAQDITGKPTYRNKMSESKTKNKKLVWWLRGEGACCQVWQPEFSPREGGRTNFQKLLSDLYMRKMTYMHTCTYIVNTCSKTLRKFSLASISIFYAIQLRHRKLGTRKREEGLWAGCKVNEQWMKKINRK